MLSEDDIAIDPPAEDKPVQRQFTWKELSKLNRRHNAHVAYRGKASCFANFSSGSNAAAHTGVRCERVHQSPSRRCRPDFAGCWQRYHTAFRVVSQARDSRVSV